MFNPHFTAGDASEVFHPMTDAVSSEGMGALRVSFGMDANSGACKMRAGYQVSTDGVSWTGTTAAGAWRTSDGTTFGTSFSTVTIDEPFVRFGLILTENSGSLVEACLGRLRVDVRQA